MQQYTLYREEYRVTGTNTYFFVGISYFYSRFASGGYYYGYSLKRPPPLLSQLGVVSMFESIHLK